MSPPVVITEGRRVYIQTSYGCPSVPLLKQLGCKPEYRDGKFFGWWIGSTKKEEVDKIVAEAATKEPVKQNPHDIRLTGKGRYKGREYYAGAITKDGTKVRLLTLPDTEGNYLDFWARCELVEQTKVYTPREKWNGRRGSNETVTVYTTLGSIADFVAEQRKARESGMPACASCGKHGDLTNDLEDGLMKCRSCCDIPEEEK